jgi:hypothetical protein
MVDQHITPVRAADERGADGMRQRPDRPSPPLAQERPTIVWVAIGEEGWGDPPVNGITMITVNSAQALGLNSFIGSLEVGKKATSPSCTRSMTTRMRGCCTPTSPMWRWSRWAATSSMPTSRLDRVSDCRLGDAGHFLCVYPSWPSPANDAVKGAGCDGRSGSRRPHCKRL